MDSLESAVDSIESPSMKGKKSTSPKQKKDKQSSSPKAPQELEKSMSQQRLM